jgi:urease accessory protein
MFLTWQLLDSAFPTGTFAHSWGLEAAWQQGAVGDGAALVRFLEGAAQATAFGMLPLMNEAYDHPERWAALDELANAVLTNEVANRASRQQGRTLLATTARVWPSPAVEAMKRQGAGTWAHVGPVAGLVFRHLGVPAGTARRMLLFGTVRGVLAAAVRLGIVGGYEGQRLQFEAGEMLERLARRAEGLMSGDLAQTAPVPDLLQMGHDRLYSRLFQS